MICTTIFVLFLGSVLGDSPPQYYYSNQAPQKRLNFVQPKEWICPKGLSLNALRQCVQPEVERYIYLFESPKLPVPQQRPQQQQLVYLNGARGASNAAAGNQLVSNYYRRGPAYSPYFYIVQPHEPPQANNFRVAPYVQSNSFDPLTQDGHYVVGRHPSILLHQTPQQLIDASQSDQYSSAPQSQPQFDLSHHPQLYEKDVAYLNNELLLPLPLELNPGAQSQPLTDNTFAQVQNGISEYDQDSLNVAKITSFRPPPSPLSSQRAQTAATATAAEEVVEYEASLNANINEDGTDDEAPVNEDLDNYDSGNDLPVGRLNVDEIHNEVQEEGVLDSLVEPSVNTPSIVRYYNEDVDSDEEEDLDDVTATDGESSLPVVRSESEAIVGSEPPSDSLSGAVPSSVVAADANAEVVSGAVELPEPAEAETSTGEDSPVGLSVFAATGSAFNSYTSPPSPVTAYYLQNGVANEKPTGGASPGFRTWSDYITKFDTTATDSDEAVIRQPSGRVVSTREGNHGNKNATPSIDEIFSHIRSNVTRVIDASDNYKGFVYFAPNRGKEIIYGF